MQTLPFAPVFGLYRLDVAELPLRRLEFPDSLLAGVKRPP
jgi:hypothetical protein